MVINEYGETLLHVRSLLTSGLLTILTVSRLLLVSAIPTYVPGC